MNKFKKVNIYLSASFPFEEFYEETDDCTKSELEEKTKLIIKDMITNSVINNIKNLEFDFIY